MCDYSDFLKTSINDFAFASELNSILDQYLDPILSKAPLLPTSLSNNIKSEVVGAADSKVNEVKTKINNVIDSIPCSGRRMDVMEIDQHGQQRMMQSDLTFDFLTDELLAFDGVVRLIASIVGCFTLSVVQVAGHIASVHVDMFLVQNLRDCILKGKGSSSAG